MGQTCDPLLPLRWGGCEGPDAVVETPVAVREMDVHHVPSDMSDTCTAVAVETDTDRSSDSGKLKLGLLSATSSPARR